MRTASPFRRNGGFTLIDRRAQHGFTLIELSIVLVIFGLLVGGVLIGKDMIAAATIRSQLRQLEQFTLGANTFKAKYGGIPGDLRYDLAAQFGFNAGTGNNGQRDGDGMIEASGGGAANYVNVGSENICVWSDLSTSGLAPGVIYYATPCSGNSVGAQFQPSAKISKGTLVFVFSDNIKNYYELTAFTGASSSVVGLLSASLSPEIAFSIDSKLDDGVPARGIVQAMASINALNAAAIPAIPASGVCVSNAAGNPYNMVASSNAAACQLRIDTQF